jgi:hypothetical protein
MRRRVWISAGLVVMGAALAAAWTMKRDAGRSGVAMEASPSAWSLLRPIVGGAPPDSPVEVPPLTPDQIRARLFEQGSLSGTEPAGNWCVHDGQLEPCFDLRRRFEYYVLALGDVAADDIRKLTAVEARKDNGDKLAAEIMLVWDKYWQLRTYPWRHHFDRSDRATWLPAFEEQGQVRRQLLGDAWTRAFFENDEKQFKALIEHQAPDGPAPTGTGASVPLSSASKVAASGQARRAAR